ncbi:MAG: arginine--tRNA ligase [Desulfuromonadaceae bacterium]|nr:arginine--tRNA ligase [Desulfuromonadaceae bacterium]
MKEALEQAVTLALQGCYAANTLKSGAFPDFAVEVPNHTEHGDFAVNLAMMLAKAEKLAPRKIAEILVEQLNSTSAMWNRVEIAGPGFINFFLTSASWFAILESLYHQGQRYGACTIGAGEKVQVEFVSANPTGPLHIGHGRGAATGDAVAAVLQEAGYAVQREYYINDAGNQMDTLGRSIYLRYLELQGRVIEFPSDCYQGNYIAAIAHEILEEKGEALLHQDEREAVRYCARSGAERIRDGIDQDLRSFGICFDNWYSEQSLYDRDMVSSGIKVLSDRGHTYTEGGALWLRTTEFGDDKDRVLVRANGATTYFASDIAYHQEKYARGFDTVIDVWGADHHGYVPRMKAMLAALGLEPERLQIILVQLVNLLRGAEPVAMSTRGGTFVTLREVLDEVGKDACRFFFLMRRSDSQLDFDLELAKQQNNENPVFYVQYAHARVCSINRKAAEEGIALPCGQEVDLSLLSLEEELALVKLLHRYPQIIEAAALHYEPHRITFYLQELAARFHSYYNQQRVIVENASMTQARLYLVNAVKIVLANALRVLGVSAPEQM